MSMVKFRYLLIIEYLIIRLTYYTNHKKLTWNRQYTYNKPHLKYMDYKYGINVKS